MEKIEKHLDENQLDNLISEANWFGNFFYNNYHSIHSNTVISFDRLMAISMSCEKILKRSIEGSIIEFGVFKGGSAKLILQKIKEFKSKKMVYLFDTFEGLKNCDKDKDLHKNGDFNNTSEQLVKNYLQEFDNFEINKGLFPETIREHHKNDKYSLVHIDTDTYRSYIDCLEFVHPRMSKGSIIISDDYAHATCPGAKLAVNEFYADKQQKVIELKTKQCIIVY